MLTVFTITKPFDGPIAVIQLLTDEKQRRRFGNQARIAAIARFDARRMVDDYLAWYREIIACTRDVNHAEMYP